MTRSRLETNVIAIIFIQSEFMKYVVLPLYFLFSCSGEPAIDGETISHIIHNSTNNSVFIKAYDKRVNESKNFEVHSNSEEYIY